MTNPAPTARPPAAQAVRYLGRFQLLRLLGKTTRSMQWLVMDGASSVELMLVMPREKPPDAAQLAHWLAGARRAARVEHPGVLNAIELGEQEQWPYMAFERSGGVLLSERLANNRGVPAAELVPGMVPVLEGLAFAHEAGVCHHDLHAGMVLVPETGPWRILGLGAVLPAAVALSPTMAARQAAERDVLASGLLLHQSLAGRPALDEPDLMRASERLAPLGNELVRLPFTDVQPIAEPLRAIVNRATDRQPRQRYRSARTLAKALSGWLRTTDEADGGPLALLRDRMRLVGLLPAMPGGVQRARRLQLLERERFEELADIVLEDLGLSFELLRAVNWATKRVGANASNGPILTVRRAIAMLGLDGVRRAAQALKPWPGPLGEAQAADLNHQMGLARQAALVGKWVRPAGYDGELVFLLTLMQRLGRLAVQYHFPDESAQIRRLMQPATAAKRGDADDPGMSEQAAAYAVLGVDLDALTLAVGRYWGLDEAALHMMRRMPLDAPVHQGDTDGERLRMTASCANEVVDAQQVPAHHRAAALALVAQRYGRALGVSLAELQQCALGVAPEDREAQATEPRTSRTMPL